MLLHHKTSKESQKPQRHDHRGNSKQTNRSFGHRIDDLSGYYIPSLNQMKPDKIFYMNPLKPDPTPIISKPTAFAMRSKLPPSDHEPIGTLLNIFIII